MARILGALLPVAAVAWVLWAVLGAAAFSMDGAGGALRDLPFGFWLLLVVGVASFLLLTVGLLLRRR